jgi:hypothetical protein
MAAAGRKSGTLIQALRYLGKKNIDEKVLSILKRQIKPEDHEQISNDFQYAPSWVADILRSLIKPSV